MSRTLRVAAAQMGPVSRSDEPGAALERALALVERAHAQNVDLVVLPEVALTPFFPHWLIEDEADLDRYFHRELPDEKTQPLFDLAARLGIAVHLGYAELEENEGRKRRFNSCVLIDRRGRVAGKYRKIHLPGTTEFHPEHPFQNLEKRYFEVGDLGFPVFEALGARIGMCICNDRRWPEAYRLLGLKDAELILIGYNTPKFNPDRDHSPEMRMFHNHLSMQAGAYQNGAYVIGAAKAGLEEGCDMIGGSCVISPDGVLLGVAESEGDELVVADCDLDLARQAKKAEFDMARNRLPDRYEGLLDEYRGAEPDRSAER